MSKVLIGRSYRHYKGNWYRVLLTACDSETLEETVVYENIRTGETWVRPKKMFLSMVKKNGNSIERFKLVGKSN